MNKLFWIGMLLLTVCLSCNKIENTYKRVGFYCEAKQTASDLSYDLYIDDQYQGKINVLAGEPEDTSLLLFTMLDSKQHIIDVKSNGKLLNATYLQVTKNKVSSGTNRAKTLHVSGVNGWKCHSVPNKSYMIYAAFK